MKKVDKIQVGAQKTMGDVGFLDDNTEVILKTKEGSNIHLKGEMTAN